DATEGDAVAMKVPADLVGGVEEIVDLLAFEGEEPAGLVAGDFAPGDDPAGQGEQVGKRCGVRHGGSPTRIEIANPSDFLPSRLATGSADDDQDDNSIQGGHGDLQHRRGDIDFGALRWGGRRV